MDAILGQAFLAIQARLADQLPELKFIDLDTGQLEYKDGERPAVLLPCALIDFIHADYEDLSSDAQIATGILQVRLGVDPFTGATHYFTTPQKQKALDFFNVEHRLNQKLHGWNDSEIFTPLMRTRAQTEHRSDKLRVRVLHYKFGFNDFTAMDVTTTVETPDMVLDVETPID